MLRGGGAQGQGSGGGSGKSLNAAEYLAFLIKFKEIPPGSVREDDGEIPTFRSMEERCNACEIFGGKQNPCQPKANLRLIERTYGRPCPRILLHPDNVDVIRLASSMLSEVSRPFVRDEWLDMTRGLPREEAQRIRQRAMAAANSRLVSEALYPKKKDEDKKKR